MKSIRILLLMAVALICSGLSAQNFGSSYSRSANSYVDSDDDLSLREIVTVMNSMCPEDLGDGMVLQSFRLNGQNLDMTMMTTLDDDTINMIGYLSESFEPMMIEMMYNEDGMDTLMYLCIVENVNFRMIFKNRTGASATLTVTPDAMYNYIVGE